MKPTLTQSGSTRPTKLAPAGRHALADFHGVCPELLQDEQRLMSLFTEALERHGFHQLGQQSHKFPGPGGVTGFVLLSESHAAFHSYPEVGFIAVDVFSCGMADPAPVIQALCEVFQPDDLQLHVHRRGH
ncbi:MAG: adenosylmethionine decarboxylase [Planctomycetales bacterium]|nr:adenosylmethionine decarboxylase [Planctomycetales bacterium]